MNWYALLRQANTLANPTPRRVKNLLVGRTLSKLGFWKIWR